MGEEERWRKVREIVREECERMAQTILAALEKHGAKKKLGFENGRWTGVTEEQLAAWRAAYGSVDIDAELRKAAAWIVSNPHYAPKAQLGRFLNTWFSRTQDRSAIRSIPTRSESGPGKKLCSYCDQVATSCPNRIWACDAHIHDAMDQKPVPIFKNPVTAKPVAGQ